MSSWGVGHNSVILLGRKVSSTVRSFFSSDRERNDTEPSDRLFFSPAPFCMETGEMKPILVSLRNTFPDPVFHVWKRDFK